MGDCEGCDVKEESYYQEFYEYGNGAGKAIEIVKGGGMSEWSSSTDHFLEVTKMVDGKG